MIAEANPEVAARMAGQVFGLLILGLGIAKCWSISRRATTNTKCVVGLLLVLAAWWAGSAGGLLLTPWPALRPLFALVGLGAFGLITAAIIVSVLGLAEYANQPGKYVQGRAQAIWALVLSGVLLLAVA